MSFRVLQTLHVGPFLIARREIRVYQLDQTVKIFGGYLVR